MVTSYLTNSYAIDVPLQWLNFKVAWYDTFFFLERYL